MGSKNNKVLVTGASGFVGHAVARALVMAGKSIVASSKQILVNPPYETKDTALTICSVGAVNGETRWENALENVGTVIHCAARTHSMRDANKEPLLACREVNVAGTMQLARQAVGAGVQRFLYLSSIKVNGENTVPGKPITEANAFAPEDAYAQSKAEAEIELMSFAQKTGMEVVIIRPPLVVGPGAKGNIARMVQWAKRGLPLPLGSVDNRRSLVSLENLVSLLLLCAERDKSPSAANQVFVVSDDKDVSTKALLQKIGHAAGCTTYLIPVPPIVLRAAGTLLGKRDVVDRLLGDLQVDSIKVRTLLGWRPVVTLEQQLNLMF
jgi:nucleoside-diphosphate-sugar epimerase